MKRLKDLCLVAEGTWDRENGKFICDYHTKTGHLYIIEIDAHNDEDLHYMVTVPLMGNARDQSIAQSGAFLDYNDEQNYLCEDWLDDGIGWSMHNTDVSPYVVSLTIKIYELI